MLTEDRREKFKADVADQKLRTGGSRHDGLLRAAGVLLMIVGVSGAFIAYNGSLTQDDLRDIGSFQILAVGFLALTVLGGALYLAAAITRVLRLWLLRQLAEFDQLSEVLRGRD